MPSKIKDNFAYNVMTKVLGDEPNAFGNGYNCFERMLQCHCERDDIRTYFKNEKPNRLKKKEV